MDMVELLGRYRHEVRLTPALLPLAGCLCGAVSARRRGVGLFECSLVMGGGVFSLATFALVSFPFYPALVLFSFRKVQATC